MSFSTPCDNTIRINQIYISLSLMPFFIMILLQLNFNPLPYTNQVLDFNFNIFTVIVQFWVMNNTTFAIYLSILFFFFSKLLIKFKIKLLPALIFIICYLLLIYNYLILEFTIPLSWTYARTYNYNLFNNLLLNKINYIHPFLFFYATSLMFILLGLILFIILLDQRTLSITIKSFGYTYYSYLKFSFLITYILIFLGAWWAFQEGTWGGWWAWDPSELLSLTMLLILLYLIHIKYFLFSLLNTIRNVFKLVIIFILNYTFLQLNFTLTSHNFGNTLNFFTSEPFFMVIFLLAVSSLCHFSTCVLISYNNLLSVLLRTPLYVLLLVVYLYANLDLINYFIWSYLKIELQYVFIIFYDILTYLYVYLYILFSFKQLFILEIFVFSLANSLVLLLALPVKTTVKLLHAFVLLFINITLISTNFDIGTNYTNLILLQLYQSWNLSLSEGMYFFTCNNFTWSYYSYSLINSAVFQFLSPSVSTYIYKNILITTFNVINFSQLFLPTLLSTNLIKLITFTTFGMLLYLITQQRYLKKYY